MLHKVIFITLIFSFFAKANTWSWLHKKFFTQKDYARAINNNQLAFEKINIQPFTQLILSWNAVRPKKGNYTFFVQAHNAKTNQWTPLYKAVEWGAEKQRSFHNNSSIKDINSQYVNIRLEMINAYADGFRILCTAENDADISLVKMIAVNTLDTRKFAQESITNKYKSIHIPNVPYASQFLIKHKKCAELCSPTSTSLLVQFLTNKKHDIPRFADLSYDAGLQAYGSWPFNTAHAYEQTQGNYWFYAQRLNSWRELYKKLHQKIPVVVSVRGKLRGAPKEFPGGHLLLVVGYDAKNNQVLCHDSSALFKYYNKEKNALVCPDKSMLNEGEAVASYNFNDFIQAWERSFRTAYIAEPR